MPLKDFIMLQHIKIVHAFIWHGTCKQHHISHEHNIVKKKIMACSTKFLTPN
jgi:hypothetical protein